LADKAAKERQRQAAERQAAEIGQRERVERDRVAKERSKATRERIAASLTRITEDNRMNEIVASARRSEAFRSAALNDAARRQFWANYDQTFRELNDFFDPPPPPIVRLADDED
jgi:hypothetical protein